jgi:uncharacterized protein (DUF433 family)
MSQAILQVIEATSGVRGGKPRVAGTRITVADIVIWTEQGLSPDEIVNEHGQLTLSGVHSALAWYYANQSEIDLQIRESEVFAENLKEQQSMTDGLTIIAPIDGETPSGG